MIDLYRDYVTLTPRALEIYKSIKGVEFFGCIKPLLKIKASDYENFPEDLNLTHEQLVAASYAMYQWWLNCGDRKMHQMQLIGFIGNLVDHTDFSKEYAVATFPDLKKGQLVEWMHGKQHRSATVLTIEKDRVYLSGKNKEYWIKKTTLIPKMKSFQQKAD